MDPVTKRFRRVLDVVYGGNVGQMAHDIGVDRSTCSRYKDGKTKPNRRSLMALSHAQHISLEWLERGNEEDIQYEPQSSSTNISEWGLKVFRAPVLNVTEEAQAGEAGLLFAPPPSFYEQERYWIEMCRDITDHSVRVRDFLLVQPCAPRKPSESDVDRLRIVIHKHDPQPVVLAVTKASVRKGNQEIVGTVLMLHRDLQG